jgi:hypothetical protein
MLVLMVMSWESSEHRVGACGFYPCGILAALAMIYLVIPIGAFVAAAILAWRATERWCKGSRKEPGDE